MMWDSYAYPQVTYHPFYHHQGKMKVLSYLPSMSLLLHYLLTDFFWLLFPFKALLVYFSHFMCIKNAEGLAISSITFLDHALFYGWSWQMEYLNHLSQYPSLAPVWYSSSRLELGECKQDLNSVTVTSTHYGVSGKRRLKIKSPTPTTVSILLKSLNIPDIQAVFLNSLFTVKNFRNQNNGSLY